MFILSNIRVCRGVPDCIPNGVSTSKPETPVYFRLSILTVYPYPINLPGFLDYRTKNYSPPSVTYQPIYSELRRVGVGGVLE